MPASASALVVGLSEQQAASWSDARLRALGVHYARLTVPWDAATSEPAKVQAWLDAVAAAGATPHVAFEHLRSDRCPNSPCVVPSRSTYASAVRAFIAKWPQVKTYTTWNEGNHGSQPVADRPETVAGYYEELRAACPGCTVVAGDVVDSGSYVRWLERFASAASPAPTLWGLHNYSDVTYGTSSRTDAALAAVSGDLWIEETGGLVARWDTRGRVLFSASESDAAAAIDRAFQIATERSRITRMYVYQWKAWPTDTFDAGLARPNGTLRPSYDAFKRDLAALGSSSGGGGTDHVGRDAQVERQVGQARAPGGARAVPGGRQALPGPGDDHAAHASQGLQQHEDPPPRGAQLQDVEVQDDGDDQGEGLSRTAPPRPPRGGPLDQARGAADAAGGREVERGGAGQAAVGGPRELLG